MVAIDGSYISERVMQLSLNIAKKTGAKLIGTHVYTAKMHRTRFEEMEPGLPDRYQQEERLDYLRNTHDSLISDGMVLISDSYLEPLKSAALENEIEYEDLSLEGRAYTEILKAINRLKPDLIVIGAWGSGEVPGQKLGSNARRILLMAKNSDILVVRKPLDFKYSPIVACVDGSDNSFAALSAALSLGKLFDAQIYEVAVFDPFFHTGVFGVISESLPSEAKQRFNFAAQEELHDEIIDVGLEKMYMDNLERGKLLAAKSGLNLKAEVLKGKVFDQINHFSSLKHSPLVVVGRYGLHEEEVSPIGSNTDNIVELSETNVLVVKKPEDKIDVPRLKVDESELEWSPQALEYMKRVPFFARGIAKKAIETRARERELKEIDVEFVREIASKTGMDRRSDKE